jgi:hypothetical protein
MSDRVVCVCPKCGKECGFPTKYVGEIGACSRCDTEFTIRQTAAEARRQARTAAQCKLLDAVAAWLEKREFQVEGHWKKPHELKEVLIGKVAIFAAKKIFEALAGLRAGRGSLQGGGTQEQLAEAMIPLVRATDLVAVKFGGMLSANQVVGVILADSLYPDEVTASFKKIMESASAVGKLGMQLSKRPLPTFVYPLVAYTRSKWFAKDASQILVDGSDDWRWSQVHFRAAVVDIEAKRIAWPEEKGLFGGKPLFATTPFLSDADIGSMFSAAGTGPAPAGGT